MSIFPSSPTIGDEYSGYRWDGAVWQVIGINLNADYALSSELTSALADTTGVHGITDTSTLSTQTYADTTASNQISTHNTESTSVHGISDTAQLATQTYVNNAISNFVTGDGITDIVALTQAEYDALTPSATTLYVVTD